jgi:hypothetical protein
VRRSEDPELGFCILGHVYHGAKDSNPHDDGPSWAVHVQMAEVAVSGQMFVAILSLIARLRTPPAPA